MRVLLHAHALISPFEMRPLGRHFSLFSRYKGFFHPMHPTESSVASPPAIRAVLKTPSGTARRAGSG
jgi:hypothetical protein